MSAEESPRRSELASRALATVRKLAPPLLTLLCSLSLWHFLAASGLVNALILPRPIDVLQTLGAEWHVYGYHMAVTMLESLGGFGLALVFAVIVSVPIALIPTLDRALMPWIIAGQAFPKEALSPLLAVWLGYSMLPKTLLSGMICFFPIAIALIRGLLAIDTNTVDMLRVLGASRMQQLLLYRIPNSIPSLLTGIRIALPLSLIGAVVGEFAGSSAGLGYLIRVNRAHLEPAFVFGCLVLLALLGISYFVVVLLLERRLRRYTGESSSVTV